VAGKRGERKIRACKLTYPAGEKPGYATRAEKDAQAATQFFRSRFTDSVKDEWEAMENVKEESEAMENTIKEKRQKMSNELIQEVFEGWVLTQVSQ